MPAVALSKPGATPTGLVIKSGDVGVASGDYFRIKAVAVRWRMGSPSASTTGDGDEKIERENNLLLYTTCMVRGYMLNAYTVNGAYIVDTTYQYVDVDFYYGATRRFAGTFLMEWVDAEFNKEAPFVPISLTMSGTSTTQTVAVTEPTS